MKFIDFLHCPFQEDLKNKNLRAVLCLGSNSFSQYSEHDDRAAPQKRNFKNNAYQGKITNYRGNSRRGGGRYRGNRGHNNNYRGNFRGNRGRRPYG